MKRRSKLWVAAIVTVLLWLMVALYVRQLRVQLELPPDLVSDVTPPACELIELSGTLRRPAKWSPVLQLVPATGRVKSFDLTGSLLDDIPDGTHVRVKGIVRSGLHRGGTEDNPSPFPPGWNVYLIVTELEILNDPMIMPQREAEAD